MKTVGIVAEYNPFHLGHEYHIQQSKKLTGAEAVVCIMSGNFTQRGEPALVDKWARAKMALLGGADLVIELPTIYAVASAPYFAFAAVQILNSMGIIDYLSFGSEHGDISPLMTVATLLEKEPSALSSLIKDKLCHGLSYPRAREEAIRAYFAGDTELNLDFKQRVHQSLATPNNVLGINYIRSLLRLQSCIKPIAIQRVGSGYHETDVQGGFASATGIRQIIKDREGCPYPALQTIIPETSLYILKDQFEQGRGPVWLDSFTHSILYLLRRSSQDELAALPDVTEGFEGRLKQIAYGCTNINQLLTELKTKRFTWTRIQRNLIHLMLGLNKLHYKMEFHPYIRVLGFTDTGQQLLRQIKNQSLCPIITKLPKQMRIWKNNSNNPIDQSRLSILQLDIRATDLYMLASPSQQHRIGGADFLRPIVLANR